MSFKPVLDADGKLQFSDDGKPLFQQPNGEPTPIDIDALYDSVRAVGGEAAAHRKEKEALQERLKAFEGLDPETARNAIETAKLVEDGKLLDAGKLDELKAKYVADSEQKVNSLTKALEEAKTSGEKALQDKEQVIHNLLVKDAFNSSVFLREKTLLPPDFAYANFNSNFTVDYQEGRPVVVAKDAQGNILFSPTNPSQYASPEEAIKMLVEQHPQRDSLLKAPSPNGGSGASGNGRGGHAGTPKSLADCKTEAEKIAYLDSVAG